MTLRYCLYEKIIHYQINHVAEGQIDPEQFIKAPYCY